MVDRRAEADAVNARARGWPHTTAANKPTLSKAIRHLAALALAAEMKRPKRESAPVKRPRKPKA
jgi:hypothetical protein